MEIFIFCFFVSKLVKWENGLLRDETISIFFFTSSDSNLGDIVLFTKSLP